jgi:hypothetical protein
VLKNRHNQWLIWRILLLLFIWHLFVVYSFSIMKGIGPSE